VNAHGWTPGLPSPAACTACPGGPLAIGAARYSVPAALDEWTELALTAVRLAAVALQADLADMLAALLTGRTAVEQLGTEEA
jgi:hypothetical protein